jgi:hypothetical protein
MNFIITKSKNIITKIVDRVNGKIIDLVILGVYGTSLFFAYQVIKTVFEVGSSDIPIVSNPYPSTVYAILIILPLIAYYLTFAGEYFNKPSRKVQLFVFTVTLTSIFSIGYILQIANLGFVGWLNSITNLEVIPSSLLRGNIKLITFIFPLGMVIPIMSLIVQMVADKKLRKDIREQEFDILLPTVYKMDDTTVDLKICEDMETGEDCIVPEKKTYEHTFLQGGTGSGKTATYIKPVVKQLFQKKAYLREKQKEIAYKCLKQGIARLNQPVSNHYFNHEFSMNLISPVEGREEEFKEKFSKYILGIRDKEERIEINNNYGKGGTINLESLSGENNYEITVNIIKSDKLQLQKLFFIEPNETSKVIKLGDYGDIQVITEDKLKTDKANNIQNGQPVIEEKNEEIKITLPKLKDDCEYRLEVFEKGSGKIIYKNLGMCVVAPDGGLPSDTIEIGKKHGVKVHKIDPTMSEIRNGKIAKFNPLKGGRPDKTGDIISSILVSMDNDQGTGNSNPYFTNASIRAVRNLVILLKVAFPLVWTDNPNATPTLRDVLDCLNDFKKVKRYVDALQDETELANRWGSVIQYFKTNFYDDGPQRQKTESSLSGIINQLDNFITREEVAYILCDEEESLDLNEMIENGECMAIASRQNELGERLGKAFALFFILSIQNTVLSRYSEDENPEIPYHLIIDEFPFYINNNTKVFFTFARKYHCAVTVAIQNMAQLREISDVFRETIFTNTDTKVLLPKSNVEDRKYWSEYFGTHQSFEMMTGVNSSSIFADNPRYSEQRRGTIQDVSNISEKEIHDLNFKEALYSYTDKKGRTRIGKGITDFMDEETNVKFKEYNFEKFNKDALRDEYDLRAMIDKKDDKNKKENPEENYTENNIMDMEETDSSSPENEKKSTKEEKTTNKHNTNESKKDIIESGAMNNVDVSDVIMGVEGEKE